MADETIERNASTLEALRELAASLSDGDLDRSLGGGWVVATAFAHLAFWDRRQALTIRHYLETKAFLEEDETVNPSIEPLLLALPPRRAVDLALGAGELVNETVAGLDGATRASIEASPHAYLARRWAHREEHMNQIKAQLAAGPGR